MYFSQYHRRFIVDAIDITLISFIIMLRLALYLQAYFSEEARQTRLRDDLISQAKLVNTSSSIKKSSSSIETKKIYKIFFRGGDQVELYEIADQIKAFVTSLLIITKKRFPKRPILNSISFGTHWYLRLVMHIWRINQNYICIDTITKQTITITMISGGTAGFVIGWFGVGATLAFNLATSVLLGRTVIQQFKDHQEYQKIRKILFKFLREDQVKAEFLDIAQKINANDLKLNWEQNPKIQEAVERLGIVEEISKTGLQKSTGNDLYKRYSLKKLKKAAKKLTDIESDLDIIDVSIIPEEQSIPLISIRAQD